MIKWSVWQHLVGFNNFTLRGEMMQTNIEIKYKIYNLRYLSLECSINQMAITTDCFVMC